MAGSWDRRILQIVCGNYCCLQIGDLPPKEAAARHGLPRSRLFKPSVTFWTWTPLNCPPAEVDIRRERSLRTSAVASPTARSVRLQNNWGFRVLTAFPPKSLWLIIRMLV